MLRQIEEAKEVSKALEAEEAKYVTSDPRIFAKKGNNGSDIWHSFREADSIRLSEELVGKLQTIALNWTGQYSILAPNLPWILILVPC